MNNNESITGLYKHFKGDLYLVFGFGKHTTTEEKCVVYRPFTDPQGDFFVREAEEFFSKISIEDEVFDRFTKLTDDEATKEVSALMEKIYGEEVLEHDCGCTDNCNCKSPE